MALDKVSPAMMNPLSVGESAPSEPYVGQRWYRASTGVTYQYTNDGTSSFWLDVTSGGIGTSANRGVDFVGDTDPHKATNGSGLAVGSVYYNREKNRHFVCTNATTDANVWSGRYDGIGGIVTDYVVSGTPYRSHTFLASATFSVDDSASFDILIVGGGGGSGSRFHSGGGGAGGVRQLSGTTLTKGSYAVTVGKGGLGGTNPNDNYDGDTGVASSLGSYAASGGGWGSAYNGASAANIAGTGGSGGGHDGGEGGTGTGVGQNPRGGVGNAGNYSPVEGYAGSTLTSSSGYHAGGGGGGAGGIGGQSQSGRTDGSKTADGGIGIANYWRDGNTSGTTIGVHLFGGGGAGSTGYNNTGHGGTAAVTSHGGGAAATAGTANSGGGGGAPNASSAAGSTGGSGIVVVRYAL